MSEDTPNNQVITDSPQLLTRDSILSADDFSYEIVEVPEWGGSVRIRGLSGEERDQLEARMVRVQGQKTELNTDAFRNFRAAFLAMSIVDQDGKRLFTDRDVEALGRKSSRAVQRVFNACQKLSAFTDEDIAEITGEMAEDPTDGSSSD